MSAGVVHARTASYVLVGTSVVAVGLIVASDQIGPAAIALVVGAALGVLITPDIDQEQRTYEENRIFHWWRPLGWLWFVYWLPYAKFFKHSRLKEDKSFIRDWSHRHVLGTLTRFIYLLWPLLIYEVLYCRDSLYLFGFIFVGWCVQDSVHIIQDKVHTRFF